MFWIRIEFGQLCPDSDLDIDWDPGGKKDPHKKKQSEEISCYKVLDVLF
jgi:hypothetical protein